MTIDNSGRLTIEDVPSDAVLETIFDLFQDDRTVLVELDADSRVVRCNPGYASASSGFVNTIMGAFPPDTLAVRIPATARQPRIGAPAPKDYPYITREEWTHSDNRCCRFYWYKLWAYRHGARARFLKLGTHETGEPEPGAADHDGQFRAFLDAAPDAIITIDEHGIMVSANPATERLFGHQPSELLGRNVSVLMPGPDRERHDDYLDHYLRTGEARIIGIGRDIVARRKDGSTFPARLSVSEFTTGEGKFFTGILHDISERIEAQEQQRAMFTEHAHASRVVALGEMASSIAHEINQPLTAIVSYADASRKLIEKEQYDTDTLSHALKQISGQGQRAGEIIRRLREFVKKKAPARNSSDINEIIQTAVAFTTHDLDRYGITLDMKLEHGTMDARVDRLQIEQVVLNLIRNSLDAIHEAGCQNGHIDVASRLENGVISILVSDNGPGIKPSEYGNVFDAFYTTKETGTGLGLSISHSILQAHGGSLTFRANKDAGVTFIMTIPVHADE